MSDFQPRWLAASFTLPASFVPPRSGRSRSIHDFRSKRTTPPSRHRSLSASLGSTLCMQPLHDGCQQARSAISRHHHAS